MIKKSIHMVAGLLCVLGLTLATPAYANPRAGIKVQKIVLAQDPIFIERQQLIEVHIRNESPKDIPLIVRLKITLPNHNIITFGGKEILAKQNSDTPALIPYFIDGKGTGDYTIAAKVYDSKGRLLFTSEEDMDQYFFALNPKTRNEPPKRRRGPKAPPVTEVKLDEKGNPIAPEPIEKEGPFQFEPADLVLANVEILNHSVLRGETSHVRIRLVNEGGDVAQNVPVELFWFFIQRPGRRVSFLTETIPTIAPGETKIIELPVTIPPIEQEGKYNIFVRVDPNNLISEKVETNNEMATKGEMIFGDVALDFPENNHSFAEEGRYLFAWRSEKFTTFKVQVSADPNFSNEEAIFELPLGKENWTPTREINPLPGEMPTLALALMDKHETDHLFWRVVARDAAGHQTESQARRFYITLGANGP